MPPRSIWSAAWEPLFYVLRISCRIAATTANQCSMHYLWFVLTARMLWIVLCTSLSISFSTYSMVRTFFSPVFSSTYSSVRCVTVSPTTLSDSRTLVAPSLARRDSLGKSSLEGRNAVRNYRADIGTCWLVTRIYVLLVTNWITTYNILLNSFSSQLFELPEYKPQCFTICLQRIPQQTLYLFCLLLLFLTNLFN